MGTKRLVTELVLAMACAVLMPAATAFGAEAAASQPALGIWSDPEFQKQFLASFGALSDLEPRINPVEKQQLEKLIPLLGSDPAAAEKELLKLTTPQSTALFDFTLGNLAFQSGNLEAARTRFTTAVGKFPSFRRAHKNLGLVEVRAGNYEAAVRSLGRVIELGGGDGLTFGLLGHACSAAGQFVSAESAYRNAILLQADTVDWRLGLVQSLLKQQKFAETASLAEELLRKFPERSDLWLIQAGAQVGLGQTRQAAENYEVVRRMGKATMSNLYTLGDLYAHEGLWDMALGAYQEGLEKDPAQAPARPLRNLEMMAQGGATTQARRLLERTEALLGAALEDADRKKLLRLKARLAAADGETAGAAKALEEVVALDPTDGEALLLLGQSYASSGDLERAVFCYERAEGLESTEAEARLRHAKLLVSQARYKEAVPLLKRAQELKPRDDVGRYLEQVDRLARSQ
ncbi:MAG TPA: tetratricopeptide repeat protein [Candidatus Polarisedimenticolia bacterium]|nr:tetratricopeptide repeat protein [Candidatus Polarisedimenticolia bacterium]